ncbi:2106_t:CDS:2, partial [Gigaspora rosea]
IEVDEKSMIKNFENKENDNKKKENNIKINLVNMILETTIDQDFATNDPEHYCEDRASVKKNNFVNVIINNNDKMIFDWSELRTFWYYKRSADDRDAKRALPECYYWKEDSTKIGEPSMVISSGTHVGECYKNGINMDKDDLTNAIADSSSNKFFDRRKLIEYDDGSEVMKRECLKLEDGSELVFDRGKWIVCNARKNGGKDINFNMQSNVNIEKQVEATNIPAVRDENDEVSAIETCLKSANRENVSEYSIEHYNDKENENVNNPFISYKDAIVGPKLEKDNRLVFDPRKLIENNDAIFNIPYEEIDVETILIKSDDEGRVAKFNEDSENRVDRFDEAAGKNDIKNDSLKMQNDINMGDELK